MLALTILLGAQAATVTTPAHAQVALQGAEEGTVLLKNSGILPLSTASLKSIAVIGVDGGAGSGEMEVTFSQWMK